MRRDGYVKVVDFGLAKLTVLPVTTGDAARTATAAGIIVGLPHYMSPGAGPTGRLRVSRTDIFSFGAVFFEMLSGRRASSAPPAVESPMEKNAILNEEPPDLPPEVPPQLQRIVRRCLEKEPEKRFESAADLSFTLRSLATDSEPGIKLAPSGAPRRSTA